MSRTLEYSPETGFYPFIDSNYPGGFIERYADKIRGRKFDVPQWYTVKEKTISRKGKPLLYLLRTLLREKDVRKLIKLMSVAQSGRDALDEHEDRDLPGEERYGGYLLAEGIARRLHVPVQLLRSPEEATLRSVGRLMKPDSLDVVGYIENFYLDKKGSFCSIRPVPEDERSGIMHHLIQREEWMRKFSFLA